MDLQAVRLNVDTSNVEFLELQNSTGGCSGSEADLQNTVLCRVLFENELIISFHSSKELLLQCSQNKRITFLCFLFFVPAFCAEVSVKLLSYTDSIHTCFCREFWLELHCFRLKCETFTSTHTDPMLDNFNCNGQWMMS